MHRRELLAAMVAGGSTTTTGCLGSAVSGTFRHTPTPVDLSGEKLDDQGGMVIGRHGGPNGQIFYVNHTPTRHDNPAWFHTLSFGLFPYYFEHRQRGWTVAAIYATDYSRVEYSIADRNGTGVISSPTAPETFGNARQLTYVIGSAVHGGMGPDLIPFSHVDDAAAFIDRHGGRTISFGDVSPEFLAQYVG